MKIDTTIRNLWLAIGALAILLAIGVIGNIAGRQAPATATVAPGKALAEVANIEISQAGQSVSLHRQSESVWETRGTQNLAASGAKILGLLNNLYSLATERKVADQPDQYAALGMGEGEAIKLAIYDGKMVPMGSYWFSAKAGEANAYVRIGGDPTVWALKGSIAPQLLTKASDWADKRLFTLFAMERVKAFAIDKAGAPAQRFSRDQAGQVWKGGGPDAAKASAADIENLLRPVFGLEADSVQAVDDAAYGAAFQGLDRVFSLSLEGPQSQNVELWRKKSDANGPYLVKILYGRKSLDGKHLLMSIPAYRVGELKLQLSAPPPSPPPAKAAKP